MCASNGRLILVAQFDEEIDMGMNRRMRRIVSSADEQQSRPLALSALPSII